MVLVLVLMGSREGWRRLCGVDVFSSRASIVSLSAADSVLSGPHRPPRPQSDVCVCQSARTVIEIPRFVERVIYKIKRQELVETCWHFVV